MTSETHTINPCPYCKTQPEMIKDIRNIFWQAHCPKCHMCGPQHGALTRAIELWNLLTILGV